jgi:hypothetical protein
MTMDARKPSNGAARAAFIISLSSLLPYLIFTVVALLITNDVAQRHREDPDRMDMISGSFMDWVPITMVGFTVATPAAATALALGIWSVQRPGRPRALGAVAIALSSVVLLFGVVGLVGALNW